MHLKRSCDRCHAIKERCRWTSGSEKCDRCKRLQHVCASIRPIRPPGRRPQASPQAHGDVVCRAATVSPGVVLTDIHSSEYGLIRRMLSDNLQLFLIGSAFSEDHRQLFMSYLLMSATKLMDAAMASSIAWLEDVPQPEQSYQRASSGLAKLTTLEVNDDNDLAVCVMLGALLQTFALKLRVDDIHIICSQTLDRIKDVYEANEHIEPEKLFMLTCLVMGDLSGCLLRCKIPTLRYKPPSNPMYIDRYVGLCATLLPLLQDICELSNALSFADGSDLLDIFEALTTLELEVNQWMPKEPTRSNVCFTATDIATMLCQAQTMRAAALLIIHRLRVPYGQEDAVGPVIATGILQQLEMTLRVTGKIVTCVDLPVVAAFMDLKECDRMYWLAKLNNLVGYSSEFQSHLQGVIESVWAAKDSGRVFYWFHLSEIVY